MTICQCRSQEKYATVVLKGSRWKLGIQRGWMTCTVQDHAYIYVVSEPYFGGDLMTCAQKASENGVALNQHWLAGILRQVCAPLA